MTTLFIGTVDSAGNVVPRPAVAELDDSTGRLLLWRYLDGHEPPSTLFSSTLLRI